MLCHNCGAENPPGRRFCEECGERLSTLEHQRERDRTRARRAAARARIESEGMTPAERRRYELRTRKSALKVRPGRALGALAVIGVLVALIVVVVLAITGGANAPEKTVTAFLDSLQDRNIMAYLEYTEPVIYAEMKKQGITPNPDDYFPTYSYRISGIKLETVNSTADAAEVKIVGGIMEAHMSNTAFSTQTLDFSKHPRTVQLTKLEGGWVITNYQEVQLPYELPEQLSPEAAGVEEGL